MSEITQDIGHKMSRRSDDRMSVFVAFRSVGWVTECQNSSRRQLSPLTRKPTKNGARYSLATIGYPFLRLARFSFHFSRSLS
jgi:hypothetical protein